MTSPARSQRPRLLLTTDSINSGEIPLATTPLRRSATIIPIKPHHCNPMALAVVSDNPIPPPDLSTEPSMKPIPSSALPHLRSERGPPPRPISAALPPATDDSRSSSLRLLSSHHFRQAVSPPHAPSPSTPCPSAVFNIYGESCCADASPTAMTGSNPLPYPSPATTIPSDSTRSPSTSMSSTIGEPSSIHDLPHPPQIREDP